MTKVDLVVDHLGTLQIVVDGVDGTGVAGAVNESGAHENGTGDPSGAVGGVKVFAGVDVSPELLSFGVGGVPLRANRRA